MRFNMSYCPIDDYIDDSYRDPWDSVAEKDKHYAREFFELVLEELFEKERFNEDRFMGALDEVAHYFGLKLPEKKFNNTELTNASH